MPSRERKRFDDRNRGAAAHDHGRFAPLGFERARGGLEVRRAGVEADRRRSAFMREADSARRSASALRRSDAARRDLRRMLSRHEAEGELRGRLRGDHRLGSGSAITADDAVDLGGRPRPELLQNAEPGFARGLAQANVAEKAAGVETERAPGRRAARARGRAHRRRTRDGDATVVVVKRGEQSDSTRSGLSAGPP